MLKKQRELKLIEDELNYELKQCWMADYPWPEILLNYQITFISWDDIEVNWKEDK